MSPGPGTASATLDRIVELVMARTGFRREAISAIALSRALEELVAQEGDVNKVLWRAEAGDPKILTPLIAKALVGETYFFRYPEHFEYVASQVIPDLLSAHVPVIRAWSAGCSTGEEAYSVSACIHGCLPAGCGVQVEVVGTDLLPENIEIGQRAMYGSWSMRGLPQLYPLLQSAGGGQATILPHVKRSVRLRNHNLLDAPHALGVFHLIFCRNVLIYFDDASAFATADLLATALAPGGVMLFASMDCRRVPQGLVQVGPTELAVYQKPVEPILSARTAGRTRKETRPARAAQTSPPPSRPPPPEDTPERREEIAVRTTQQAVALHIRALHTLESGDVRGAERMLAELADLAPDYIPGILERALLLARQGKNPAAARLMREILTRIEGRDLQESISGPEPLPAAYYRATATAFLQAAPADERMRR